jgi:hypothetical protein
LSYLTSVVFLKTNTYICNRRKLIVQACSEALKSCEHTFPLTSLKKPIKDEVLTAVVMKSFIFWDTTEPADMETSPSMQLIARMAPDLKHLASNV